MGSVGVGGNIRSSEGEVPWLPPTNTALVISKIIERVVKSRLIDQLISSKLLNPHQSADC